jgi:hypothetical protein
MAQNQKIEHWVIFARKGTKGKRVARAQGFAGSGHAAIRADGCNFRKGESARWARKYVTRNGVTLTAERHDPIEGVREFRNPRAKQDR